MRFASDFVCLTDDEYGRTKPGRVLKRTVCPTALSVCLAKLGSCIVCKFYANSCVVSIILAWRLFRNFNLVYMTFCTRIALSPTYTCIHKYLTLPKITLYESCWHSGLCNSWYFLILWSFKPYCCSFHDTLSERYWSNLLSHSFWTMGSPIFEQIVLIFS